MYDIIVVGGGPAGLTAALYARRANKTVLVIEKGKTRVQSTPREICGTSVIKEVFKVQLSRFDDRKYGYIDI